MKKLSIIIVLFIVGCSSSKHSIKNGCNYLDYFSIDFEDLFNNTNRVDNLREFTLWEKSKNRKVLDCYGYRLAIDKEHQCEYIFNLELFFQEEKINVLKYKLKIEENFYTIEIDTTINPYKADKIKDLNFLKEEYISLSQLNDKEIETEKERVFMLYYELFKGGMSGENECVDLFQDMGREFNGKLLFGHDYMQMERILMDYGFLKRPHSKSPTPKIFRRKYNYE